MNLRVLLFTELRFRFMTSLMVVMAVLIACTCGVSSVILLKNFDKQTNNKVLALQKRASKRMSALENEARVFAKALGFNVFIYNSKQNLGRFYTNDKSDFFLKESQADILAKSHLALLNHLLPVLRSRYFWKEYNGEVIIGGIKGEIFVKRKWQEPMEVTLHPGEVQLGYAIYNKMNLHNGDFITIKSKQYKVTRLRKRLGTKDDITLFMNLGDAQKLLKKEGKISGILALSCNCVPGEIDPLRRSLQLILPGVDLVELSVRAKARARARKSIKKAASAELQDIYTSRNDLREILQRFSVLFFSLMSVASAVLLLFLYANNVKERRAEIAILRTIGLSTKHIYFLFIFKAFLLALIASVLGSICGIILGVSLDNLGYESIDYYLQLTGIAVLCSCLISILASWLPAKIAASQDPGVILNEG